MLRPAEVGVKIHVLDIVGLGVRMAEYQLFQAPELFGADRLLAQGVKQGTQLGKLDVGHVALPGFVAR